jgi:transposase
MAFLRAEKKPSGTYLRLVEAYRDAKAVKHRTLYTFGKLEDFKPKQLEALGRKFMELSGNPVESTLSTSVEELGRYNYGFPLLVTKLLRKIGMDVVMKRFERTHKLSYSLFDCLALMLCKRLDSPCSKRRAHLEQSDYLGLKPVNLQHLYRSLDYLAKYEQWLQEHLFKQRGKLGAAPLDMVFYDVTTFYFHSEDEKTGELRQMGFGKDGKIGKTQVLFGLLVDMKGMPVGYRVYSGDTYEGHTFGDAVKLLRQRYNIRRLIVVADSGMMNRDNTALFDAGQTASGFEYILADRLKNLKKPAQDYLCDLKNYEVVIVRAPDGTMIPLRYTTMEYEGRQILCTHSEKRAKKDAWEREKKIQKGQKLLENPGVLEKKAKHFFLKKTGQSDGQFEMDTEKIKKDARFDGFWALATNALDLTPPQLLQKYKDLYHVEHSFRTFKSFLETRPMFHWTDGRIKGHLFVCYLSYYLLAHLKNILEEDSIEATEYKIQKMLSNMEVSKVKNDQDTFFLRSNMDEITQKTLTKLQLPILGNVIQDSRMAELIA